MTDNNNQKSKIRDNEFSLLLKSVQDLGGIFKDMQSLVKEYGPIIDRRDYDIDIASTNIERGKNSLINANE